MRILLISPPTDSAIKRVVGTTGPPLSLAYLASMVREEHEVAIIDSIAEDLSFNDVRNRIKKFNPDVVGITATTSMIPDAYKVSEIAKEINENVKVVIGGPHVTFLPDKTMEECKYIDFVVRGEGELTFKELIDAIEKNGDFEGIRGLSFRKNGKVINNPPRELIKKVDEIPLPSYDLLPMEKYKADGVKFATVVTSRGCPFNCIFCSSSLQFGKRWRGHSPERVIEELSILRNEYGRKSIEFLDDTFTLVKPRAIDISKRIVKESLDISWVASSRVDTFSKEIAEAMRRAGAHTIYFGIESGTQKILDFIGKRITPEQSKSSVKKAKEAGLHTFGSFIIGFPQETRRDVKTTLKFSRRVGVDFAQFTVATPYPGTRLWNIAIKEKLLMTMNWRKFTTLDPVLKLKYFTGEQISKILEFAYIRFYLRPKVLIEDLIQNKGFIFRRAVPQVIKIYSQKKELNMYQEEPSSCYSPG